MLHPGVIALIIGSSIILLLIFLASALGIRILKKWDMKSSSEEQLSLERKTYLISTLVQYALGFELLSFFLFIYTADDIHTLLVGAMCATGSLNANSYGFPTLYAKIVTFFVSAAWIAINQLDNRAEDYPLTRTKYKLLIAVASVVLIEFILQLQYFININPDIITSCCGVLFSEGGQGIGNTLSSLPVGPTRIAFYCLLVILITNAIVVFKTQKKPFTPLESPYRNFQFLNRASLLTGFTYLSAIFSFMFFIVSILSFISFISLYIYQLPTHHCPFCVLQKEYYYIGYPLFGLLFIGCFLGIMVGLIEPFKKRPSMAGIIPQSQKQWSLGSVICLLLFALISTAPMVFLPFTLEGY